MGITADWALQKEQLVNLATAVGTVQNETQKQDFEMNRAPRCSGTTSGRLICV